MILVTLGSIFFCSEHRPLTLNMCIMVTSVIGAQMKEGREEGIRIMKMLGGGGEEEKNVEPRLCNTRTFLST
jgi:hypothetical protein